MEYKVVITQFAQKQLDNILFYIGIVLQNEQAMVSVMDDFEETCRRLSVVAASLNLCKEPQLAALGYRRILFQRHSYIMLYAIDGKMVHIDRIYHERQDYANLIDKD